MIKLSGTRKWWWENKPGPPLHVESLRLLKLVMFFKKNLLIRSLHNHYSNARLINIKNYNL